MKLNISKINHFLLGFIFIIIARETYPLTQIECLNWNATINIVGNAKEGSLHVNFILFEEYKNCFYGYFITLRKLFKRHSKNCVGGMEYESWRYTGVGIYSTFRRHDQVGPMMFTGLKRGYYCILVVPCNQNKYHCYKYWFLSSKIAFIGENITKTEENEEIIVRNTFSNSEILSIILILVFVLGCGMFLYWRCKNRTKKTVNPKRKIKKIDELPFLTKFSDICVYILYSDEMHDEALLLKDFLKNKAGFNVTLIEDVLEELLIDPISWLSKTLSYKCSRTGGRCESNKRFIIVQSERVLRFTYKMDMTTKRSKSISSESVLNEDLQTMWFYYAVNSISIDWWKGLKDYCHLFVVCFNDALCYDDRQIQISHGVRYTIPKQLVNLCMDLHPFNLLQRETGDETE